MLLQRRRGGCLGQLIFLGLLVTAVGVGVIAITNPWIFTVGGHTRLLPFWEGVGEVQGPGGTYRIFVSLQPSLRGGSRILPSTSVNGTGWICAPAGHNYKIRLGGGAPERVWSDMNNKDFALYTYQRNTWSSQHLPPRLDFAGRWVGPGLVMDDKGSTAAAFLPDGTLPPRPGARGAKQPITFAEKSWWLGNPCDH